MELLSRFGESMSLEEAASGQWHASSACIAGWSARHSPAQYLRNVCINPASVRDWGR